MKPEAWRVSYTLENGRRISSLWDNVGDGLTVYAMKREEGHKDVLLEVCALVVLSTKGDPK